MRNQKSRGWATIGLIAGGAWLFQIVGPTCANFTAQSALSATDFCFIFDCQNGILGGTFDPCTGIGSGSLTGEADDPPLLTDCPTTGTGP